MRDEQERRELARQIFEETPIEQRIQVLGVVGKAIEAQAREEGIDPEEVLTFELLEEIAGDITDQIIATGDALFEEHVPEGTIERILEEERECLYQQHGRGLKSEAVVDSATHRLRREYPMVFKREWRG